MKKNFSIRIFNWLQKFLWTNVGCGFELISGEYILVISNFSEAFQWCNLTFWVSEIEDSEILSYSWENQLARGFFVNFKLLLFFLIS